MSQSLEARVERLEVAEGVLTEQVGIALGALDQVNENSGMEAMKAAAILAFIVGLLLGLVGGDLADRARERPVSTAQHGPVEPAP